MGVFDGVLLVSDFDGTLVNAKKELSERNRGAILRFVENGGTFTVSTGRDWLSFSRIAPSIPLNAPVVLCNGSMLWDPFTDEIKHKSSLPDCCRRDLGKLASAFPDAYMEAHRERDVYIIQRGGGYGPIPERSAALPALKSVFDLPLPWTKATFLRPYGEKSEPQRFLRDFATGKYEAVYSEIILDITARGTNKGEGIKKILSELKRIKLVCCVGDNLNDKPMLDVADISFVPANSHPELLGSGANVTASCEDSCIAEIIAHLEKMLSV